MVFTHEAYQVATQEMTFENTDQIGFRVRGVLRGGGFPRNVRLVRRL
jgi:hypothetical protein